jgi:hypothetical protein
MVHSPNRYNPAARPLRSLRLDLTGKGGISIWEMDEVPSRSADYPTPPTKKRSGYREARKTAWLRWS